MTLQNWLFLRLKIIRDSLNLNWGFKAFHKVTNSGKTDQYISYENQTIFNFSTLGLKFIYLSLFGILLLMFVYFVFDINLFKPYFITFRAL